MQIFLFFLHLKTEISIWLWEKSMFNEIVFVKFDFGWIFLSMCWALGMVLSTQNNFYWQKKRYIQILFVISLLIRRNFLLNFFFVHSFAIRMITAIIKKKKKTKKWTFCTFHLQWEAFKIKMYTSVTHTLLNRVNKI